MGGTPKRMEAFAYYIMKEIGHKLPTGTTLQDISQYSYRYSMYKVGPILSVSVSSKYSLRRLPITQITAWNGSTIHWNSTSRNHQTYVPR